MSDPQAAALGAIREFLASKTVYDVLPVSYKLVMLDTTLSLKGAALTLLQNGVVSAPLWDAASSKFAGLLTLADFINVLHYYLTQVLQGKLTPEHASEALYACKLGDFAALEEEIAATKVATVSISPFLSLVEASRAIMESPAHRAPIIDTNETLKREVVVSVLTQYRVLRSIVLNCKETQDFHVPIKDINLFTNNVTTTTIDTKISELVGVFSHVGVSAIPVVDEEKKLLNVVECYDIISLVKGGSLFADTELTVGELLMRRPEDFEGVLTCRETDTLSDLLETIRRSRMLRLCVVDVDRQIQGMLSLSDIMQYILYG